MLATRFVFLLKALNGSFDWCHACNCFGDDVLENRGLPDLPKFHRGVQLREHAPIDTLQ
jgi:hypothetical protein